MAGSEISVLVVEDSAVARDLLIHLLTSDPAIRIAGVAENGREAIAMLAELKPDVVTMDIHMPQMDGFEATRLIMETQPLPIVVVTASYQPGNVEMTFRAMQAGAVAVVGKPRGVRDPGYREAAKKLVQTVKAMAEVRVVKRWAANRQRGVASASPPIAPQIPAASTQIELVAIGASTGGPPVLQTILAALVKPFPVPILIVQHISVGFVQGLADWLAQSSGMRVCLAQHGELAQPGCAYIAPDDCHLRVEKNLRLSCLSDPAESGLRPAVACLFRSVVEICEDRAVGVLLTGMGRDGADELKRMRNAGAVTLVQDRESSIVHGMPGEAIKIGAAAFTLGPEEIAATLQTLVAKVTRRA